MSSVGSEAAASDVGLTLRSLEAAIGPLVATRGAGAKEIGILATTEGQAAGWADGAVAAMPSSVIKLTPVGGLWFQSSQHQCWPVGNLQAFRIFVDQSGKMAPWGSPRANASIGAQLTRRQLRVANF